MIDGLIGQRNEVARPNAGFGGYEEAAGGRFKNCDGDNIAHTKANFSRYSPIGERRGKRGSLDRENLDNLRRQFYEFVGKTDRLRRSCQHVLNCRPAGRHERTTGCAAQCQYHKGYSKKPLPLHNLASALSHRLDNTGQIPFTPFPVPAMRAQLRKPDGVGAKAQSTPRTRSGGNLSHRRALSHARSETLTLTRSRAALPLIAILVMCFKV